jgi:hypothetical protein
MKGYDDGQGYHGQIHGQTAILKTRRVPTPHIPLSSLFRRPSIRKQLFRRPRPGVECGVGHVGIMAMEHARLDFEGRHHVRDQATGQVTQNGVVRPPFNPLINPIHSKPVLVEE